MTILKLKKLNNRRYKINGYNWLVYDPVTNYQKRFKTKIMAKIFMKFCNKNKLIKKI